jgi:lipoprotein NlpI
MQSAELHASRARLWAAKGDRAREMQEVDQALELDPRNATALRQRGRARFHAGRFEAAEQDFEARLAVQRTPYDALWVFLARARRGIDGKPGLDQWVAANPSPDWPRPVIAYLLGQTDRDALFAAAAAEPDKRAGRECEARFYLGEDLLARGRADEARALLEQARSECPRGFVEYDAAVRELDAK